MGFKDLKDIEKEREQRERKVRNKGLIEDTNEFIDGVFRKNKPKKKGFGRVILELSLLLIFSIVILNLLLGNIWLLKFLIKDLFLKGG